MNLKILNATNSDQLRWDEFVLNNNQSTPYHLFGWKKVIESTYNHKTLYLMVVDQNDEIKGILPLTILRSPFLGKIAVSVPYCNYGSICADEESSRLLINKAEELIDLEGLSYIELRSITKSTILWPCSTENVTLLLELKKNPEELWNSFKPKVRNQIRKAIKSGLISETGNHYIDDFYNIYAINMKQLGTPVHSKNLFNNIIKEFQDFITIFRIKKNKDIVASMMLFKFQNTLYDLWASSKAKYLKFCPNNILYWESLKYGCENGYESFDFGRSRLNSGTYYFKKQWGAVSEQLHYYYYSKNLYIPNFNPSQTKYKTFTNIWKITPLVFSKLFGPRLRKYIP